MTTEQTQSWRKPSYSLMGLGTALLAVLLAARWHVGDFQFQLYPMAVAVYAATGACFIGYVASPSHGLTWVERVARMLCLVVWLVPFGVGAALRLINHFFYQLPLF